MPVEPPPVTPVPAATLVLLRERAIGGFDALLIQRHLGSRFAGGDFVFPGGKVEVEDTPGDSWCAGPSPAAAASRLGLPGASTMALAYFVGAIREAFEEVGVLHAYDAAGRPLGGETTRFAEWRRACQRDPRAFAEMIRRERLTLATDRLVYFAHWITPEERPARYDTRFFATELFPGQEARADDDEIVAVRWLAPAEAAAARRRGEISLRLPTITNLALFEGAASVAEALHRLEGRPVPMIRPRIIGQGEGSRTLLPGDPGYY